MTASMKSSNKSSPDDRPILNYARSSLRSLKHVRLRWYFIGVGVSLLGTFLQLTLLRWAAFEINGSATTLGLLSLCSLVPNALLAVPAGLFVANQDKRNVLLFTQVAASAPALALFFLSRSHSLNEVSLLSLSFVLGCIIPFETAARFPLMAECVEGEAPYNAFSFSALVFYLSRCLGPLMGGLVLGLFAVSTGFLLNFVSYIVEIVTLLFMGRGPVTTAIHTPNFGDVYKFCSKFENATLLVGVALVSFLGVQLQLMPALSNRLFSSGSFAFGSLIAANELGAVAAALWLTTRTDAFDQGSILNRSMSLVGVGLLVFCFCGWFPLGLISMFVVGLGQGLLVTATQNVLQGRAQQSLRAPLASVFWAGVFCCQGIGAAVLSTTAEQWDVRSVFAAVALVLLVVAGMRSPQKAAT